MYFPYLRCKQFELLALRELAIKLGTSGRISPVLEPVKKSTTALERGINSLAENNTNFTLILNPIFGDFVSNDSPLIEMVNQKMAGYNNFQFGIIINQFTSIEAIEYLLARINFKRNISLIHVNRPNELDALSEWVAQEDIRFNLYGENIPIRRYRGIITPQSKVLLEDKFIPKSKNAHYSDTPEFFSDEHLFFQDDGNAGFGDYLTIGNDYSESGFLPYAVAIHLTYINKEKNNAIWIKHFVSDTNDDNTDVAGKFGEALEKLIVFIDEMDIQTDAANEFRALYVNGHYPGLGSLKKLSIKNHLELIMQLLP